jgi:ATP-dependent helicase/nuclease subunit A
MPELPPDHAARQRILTELDCSMLVEAGAGTGKTTSIVGRMVRLLAAGKCEIGTVAAVTFTRKAAAELRSRFQLLLDASLREARGEENRRLAAAAAQIEQCFIGTIHSFCARLLRERPVEGGVDVGFREMDEAEDRRLREAAWEQFLAELHAQGHPIIGELDELGLDLSELKPSFLRIADYPDVPEWPAPVAPPPDVAPAVKQLLEYAEHMRALAPSFPTERGNDKLMRLYERVPLLLARADLEQPADVMEILAEFPRAKPTQKEWPGGQSQGKTEKGRWEAFVQEYAEPLLVAWREHRYAPALRALQLAVEVYDRVRAEARCLNYQDLLMKAAALLRDKPHVRQYFRERFTHLLVDEFQDTDPVQAEVMLLLTADDPGESDWRRCRPVPGALFVVGDPKQSIYRFRRADIVTYSQVKEITVRTGGLVELLTANFRSVGPLVEWVNGLFSAEFPPEASEFSPGYVGIEAARPTGSDGELSGLGVLAVPGDVKLKADVVEHEADVIARHIRDALDQGATPGDFLILTWDKDDLAAYAWKLEEYAIPHSVTGGASMNQVPELALLHTCLRAAAEPDDPVALVAALRSELFGISDADLYRYKKAGGEFSYLAPVPDGLAGVGDAFGRLRRYASWLRVLPPAAAFENVAAHLGLPALAAAAPGGDAQAGSLGKALEVLRSARAEAWSPAQMIDHLADIVSEREPFDGLSARPLDRSCVRVMNLHKAKGLEAPVVFLANPTGDKAHKPNIHVDRSGPVPRGYMLMPSDGELARPAGWDEIAAREERFLDCERTRLLYVAATRAACRLTVSVRGTGSHANPWRLLGANLKDRAPIPVPDERPPDAAQAAPLDDAEVAAASEDIARRWADALAPTYDVQAVKRAFVAPGPVADADDTLGTRWGSAIHRILQVLMAAEPADVGQVVAAILREEELDPALTGAALEAVRTVARSEVWRRASGSPTRLTEVPIQALSPAPADLPTIVRGVIDLAFREEGGWVIVDYKTDAFAESRLPAKTEQYRPQVETYAALWEEIVAEPVTEKGLYFTHLDAYVRL